MIRQSVAWLFRLLFNVPTLIAAIVLIVSVPFCVIAIIKRRQRRQALLETGQSLAEKIKDQFVKTMSPDMRDELKIKPYLKSIWHHSGFKLYWEERIMLETHYYGDIGFENIKRDIDEIVAEFLARNSRYTIGLKLNNQKGDSGEKATQ